MGFLDISYEQLVAEHPVCESFFTEAGRKPPAGDESIRDVFASLDDFDLLDYGMDSASLEAYFLSYVARMETLQKRKISPIHELTIDGGIDKGGIAENFCLTAHAGEVVCIVGSTGSGKSRLLEDIEYLAQGDTPTKRRVLVNGTVPSDRTRHDIENKIVAQLSQSMVFVMDMPVRDFLRLHAESRMMPEPVIDETVDAAISCANDLAGEVFSPNASLTVLSGGQSRALMIADLAFISASPIVLIDEIENAGVDRKRALDLLISNDKIVFVVTHDPLIALMGDKRLIISNGGVRRIIEPSAVERLNVNALYAVDEHLAKLRQRVREGDLIDFDVKAYLRT